MARSTTKPAPKSAPENTAAKPAPRKLKAVEASAPASAPAPAPVVAVDLSHMKAIADHAAANAAGLRDMLATIDKEKAVAGYDAAVALSESVGLDWTDWSNFQPQKADVAAINPGETLMRQIEHALDPANSTITRRRFSDLLQMAVNATSTEVWKVAKRNVDRVFAQGTVGERSNAAQVLRGINDKDPVDPAPFVAAINDAAKIAALTRKLTAMVTAGKRTRGLIFLRLIAQDVDERMTGPLAAKKGSTYQALADACVAAHRKLTKDGPVTVEALQRAVAETLDRAIGKRQEAAEKAAADLEVVHDVDDLDADEVKTATEAVYTRLHRLYAGTTKLALSWEQHGKLCKLLEEATGVTDPKPVKDRRKDDVKPVKAKPQPAA